MFIRVNATIGFNSEQVGWWKYELPEPPPPPPDPPLLREGEGEGEGEFGEPAAAPPAPVPQTAPEAILTLYMTTGGECVLTGADAEKVRQYYSVPSSFLTVL